MQPTISQFSIPNPCSQQWHNMSPADNCRHCSSCNKVVTDFSVMTDAEIINYLGIHHNVCGKFKLSQMQDLNSRLNVESLQQSNLLKRIVLFAALIACLPSKSKAQTKADTVQVEPNHLLGKVVMPPKSPVATHIISGTITDANDRLPLPGVTIRGKNTKLSVTSDSEGKYEINLPADVNTLEFDFIGYRTFAVQVGAAATSIIDVKMEAVETLLGDVIIIRPPLHKRLYYRFIRRPWKRIFG